MAGLDVFELIGTKYCRYAEGEVCESAVCSALIDSVLENRGLNQVFRHGRKEGMFKTAIEKLYPGVAHSENIRVEDRKFRGYKNLTLNEKAILLDLGDTIKESGDKFGLLKQKLKIDSPKDRLFEL